MLKEYITRTNTETVDADQLVSQVHAKSEQSMVRLNVALFGRNLVEKLTHSLLTESVNAIDSDL